MFGFDVWRKHQACHEVAARCQTRWCEFKSWPACRSRIISPLGKHSSSTSMLRSPPGWWDTSGRGVWISHKPAGIQMSVRDQNNSKLSGHASLLRACNELRNVLMYKEMSLVFFLMTLLECEEPFFTKESWWLAPNTTPVVSEQGVDWQPFLLFTVLVPSGLFHDV